MTGTVAEVRTGACAVVAEARARGTRPVSWLAYTGVSLVVLVPCFWQERIQAGDLSSHVYNAWLAQLIERGQAPGLSLARQFNNVLFDLILSGLWRAFGPGGAQRIAVSLAVLAFFWGAFAFAWSCARQKRAPWHVAPCLAMLAYGWVFHMGLFNFYLSLGLCFGALALARGRRPWAFAALPMLGIAYTAHALPVAWALGVWAYGWLAGSLAPRYRFLLVGGALAGMGLLAALLCAKFSGWWAPGQIMALSGAEQTWVFGVHYLPITIGLLAIWILWFRRVLATRGARRTVLDARFQLWLLCAASVVIIPGAILVPGVRHSLNAIAERMSLTTAVVFCGLVAPVRPRRGEMLVLASIAAVFFASNYADERMLNRLETRMATVAADLPGGRRVVTSFEEPDSRVNCLAHMIDRVCVGRCFSYANYEPSTAQFRVRANRPNGIVVWRYGQSWRMQTGTYVVEPRDLPLYVLDVCGPDGRGICVRRAEAGVTLQPSGRPIKFAGVG